MIPAQFSGVEFGLYVIITFILAILSGAAGAGGGFVMTPLLILFGLSPAQAVSTGKLSGLAISVGSLHGMRSHKVKNKHLIYIIMLIALVVGLITPRIIIGLDNELYKRLLGVILLIMIPIMMLHKPKPEHHVIALPVKIAGFALLVLALVLQGIFSGGLGTLVNIVLITMLGLSPLDANVTKRYSQVLLNAVIVIGVSRSGLIQWDIALFGIVISLLGSNIGSRMALKKGDEFVKRLLLFFVFVAALELLLG